MRSPQASMDELNDMPLLSALAQAVGRDHAAFYAPGHKRGQGISPHLRQLLGDLVFRADLPELPELDNLFAPDGPIYEAQALAANTFGADETFFLVNGSTCGIEAAILSACAPGDSLLVPRNVHKSVLSALVLSGARPVYLSTVADSRWDLALGVTPDLIEAAMVQYPNVKGVVVVSPNYQGICANIAAIADCVHAHNGLLIVDEAHGAHLPFHEALPGDALSNGADIVVQSTHKVLSAMTQASMLHVKGHRGDRDRLRQCLQITQSTSPSYLLLASLDAARYQMATEGRSRLEKTLAIAHHIRDRLAHLPGLVCPTLNYPPDQDQSQHFQLDLTRLTVDVSALNLTGFTADEILCEQLGIVAELPTWRQLAFILSLGNTSTDGDRLIQALDTLARQHQKPGPAPAAIPELSSWETAPLTVPPLSPRDAFFSPACRINVSKAVGRIGTDTICPYPPGIPVLLPGERITAEAIAYLQRVRAAGGVITGGSDPSFQTLNVVE